MASPVYITALNPDLSFHVREDRSPGPRRIILARDDPDEDVEVDEQETERRLQEMDRDDDTYRGTTDSMDKGSGPGRRRGQGEGETGGIDYALPRTASPDSITPTPARAMTRTVTINEPIHDSIEKNSEASSPDLTSVSTPYPTRRGRRRRTFSISRTGTASSFGSFSTFVSDSWGQRKDRAHKGFWAAVWAWMAGSKAEGELGPREGHPDYIPPKYRWTLILSGLLQPFSILLEIPGLTEHWYVHTVNKGPVVYKPNPVLLDVGLAISMACAVVANIALISRFLERRVLPSTVITIVGLSIHDLINIVAITVFGVIHRFDDGFSFSEAFWLCVCSTAASMVTNATLIYDLIKTKEFRYSGSGLTPKQRSLVIIVMVLLVYMAMGALCFNFLLPDIPFQNALYYTVVSIETIGFGDITPSTLGAKIFLFFYAPIGILNLAVTVGTARDTIVESWNAAYRRRRHEVLKRHQGRKQERAEEAVHRAAIERQLEAIGVPLYVSSRGIGRRVGPKGKKLNVKALSIDQLNAAESQALDEIASRLSPAPEMSTEPFGEGADDREYQKALADARKLRDELAAQSLVSEEGYREFQERMAKEEKMENWVKFGFAFSLFLVFWIVGATVFSRTEEWSWYNGFYFCFVAFTTIGYGDDSPQTPAGRAFFIIWAIFGVATVTLLIAVLTEVYANRYKSALVRKGTKRAIHAIKDHRDHMMQERLGNQEQEHGPERIERLPYEILDMIKTFHQHVAASQHGATEANESESMRALVDKLMEAERLSEHQKAEVAVSSESRRMIFWNGYERAVHELLAVAETAVRHQENGISPLTMTELSTPSYSQTRTATLSSIDEGRPSQPRLGEKWDLEKAGRRSVDLLRRINR